LYDATCTATAYLQVQVAIDHNKKVFEARMRMEDCATLRKAFSSWRAARYGSVAKQQILLRAMARLQVIAVPSHLWYPGVGLMQAWPFHA
jgi:hypothetical protein